MERVSGQRRVDGEAFSLRRRSLVKGAGAMVAASALLPDFGFSRKHF